jgi:peptidoglycan/LPS O-acetylase OafA/YrhL
VLRLEDIIAPELNSFGALRLVAALAVVFSHAFYLTTGDATAEPLKVSTGYSLGQHAVHVFFVMSGVMVTASLMRARSMSAYLIQRLLRIGPALVVCVLLTAALLGPMLTTLHPGEYLRAPGTYRYVLDTLTRLTGAAPLPGLFADNPVPDLVNIPIWTLKYEMVAYVGLALVAVAGLSGERRAIGAAGVLVMLGYAALLGFGAAAEAETATSAMLRLGFCFAVGVAAYGFADKLPLHGAGLAVCVALMALMFRTDLHVVGLVLFSGYLVLWAAQFSANPLADFARETDLSYGIYLYGWPIVQSIVLLMPGIDAIGALLWCLTLLLPIALASWLLVERPALSLKAGWYAVPAPASELGPMAHPVDRAMPSGRSTTPQPAPQSTRQRPSHATAEAAETARLDAARSIERALERIRRSGPLRRRIGIAMPRAPAR